MTDHTPALTEKAPAPRNWRIFIIPASIVLALLIIFIATTAVVHAKYRDRVLPHVRVAGIELSGLSEIEATEKLQDAFDDMVANGLPTEVYGEERTLGLYPDTGAGGDLAFSLVNFDPAGAAKQAVSVGRNESKLISMLGSMFYASLGNKNIPADVVVDSTLLAEAIRAAFPNAEVTAVPTDFAVTFSRSIPTVTITEGIAGSHFDINDATTAVHDDATDLDLETLGMTLTTDQPDVSTEEAEELLAQAEAIINAAPYTVSAALSGGETKTWSVKAQDI
ncbi:MAG: hypothetical protein NUV56_03100, partial [Candidatus Uhrbacteria bacterium]|nr:hypothetical protein [Candidatus Uhrbacteria bacterium]